MGAAEHLFLLILTLKTACSLVPACYIAMCAVCYSASATLVGVRMNSEPLLHLLTSDLLREDHLMGVEGILVVVRELPKRSMQQWLDSAALLWGWGGSLLLPRECPAPAPLTAKQACVQRRWKGSGFCADVC